MARQSVKQLVGSPYPAYENPAAIGLAKDTVLTGNPIGGSVMTPAQQSILDRNRNLAGGLGRQAVVPGSPPPGITRTPGQNPFQGIVQGIEQGMGDITQGHQDFMGELADDYHGFLGGLQSGGLGFGGQNYDSNMMNDILGQLSQSLTLGLMQQWFPMLGQYGSPGVQGPRLTARDRYRLGRNF